MGPPPAPNIPPPLPGEVEERSSRLFRLDVSGEIASPRGEIADRQNTAKALRIGFFGTNVNQYFSLGATFRMVATSSKADPRLGLRAPSQLYFDLVGMFLRVAIPVMPQLKGFIEGEPSLVGLHVPCEDPTDTVLCNADGYEFGLRLGLTGRVGGIYEVVPDRLDLFGFLALSTTYPDEGGWLSIGVGLTVHYGMTHREIERRQQWQQQQMHGQMQPQRQNPAPPPPPPPPR